MNRKDMYVTTARASVNTERQRRFDRLTVTLDHVTYDADEGSRANLMGLVSATREGVPIPWPISMRCTDNITRPLTLENARQLLALMFLAVQEVYQKSWHLKDEVIPSLGMDDLLAFDASNAQLWK